MPLEEKRDQTHDEVPSLLSPRESKTGINNDPCLVFGNGVEIETRVWCKSPSETIRVDAQGKTRRILAKKMGPNATGVDVVKVHFVPSTSVAERANDPDLIPLDEKAQIKADCMHGYISLALALKKNEVTISSHEAGSDFYLFADTNARFANFLVNNCGFTGSHEASQVWVKASEFSSTENILQMTAAFIQFSKEIKPAPPLPQ